MSSPRQRFLLGGLSVESLNLFSDAIFAFSITLLAVDIRLPEIAVHEHSRMSYSIWLRDLLVSLSLSGLRRVSGSVIIVSLGSLRSMIGG